MMRTPLAVANWKMNNSISETIKFVTEFSAQSLPDSVEIVLCPPFTSLYTLGIALEDDSSIKIGAQNCHYELNGAYTGETSVEFLKDMNCSYVILGHSERRQYFSEDEALLTKKLMTVLETEISPIYCVGENEKQRDAGETFKVIQTQLSGALSKLSKDQIERTVIAYEPVWAIGTGKTATPEQANEVHAFIRKWISDNFGLSFALGMRILYGGSVKPENTRELMVKPDIDGVLVGGASLKATSFFDIVSSCQNS